MNGRPRGDSSDWRKQSSRRGEDRYRELQELVNQYEAGTITDREFRRRKRRILRGPLPDADRVELLVVTYLNEADADSALTHLRKLQRKGVLLIIDSTAVVRTDGGEIRMVEDSVGEIDGRPIVEGLADLFFVPMLAASKPGQPDMDSVVRDWQEYGFSDEMLTSIGNELKPGHSAVFAVIYNFQADRLTKELEGFATFSRLQLELGPLRLFIDAEDELPRNE